MITMPGVVTHGQMVWDQALFPLDEQERRHVALQAAMAEAGLGGLLVFADGVHHAETVYLTQWWPMEAWSLTILGPKGLPTILSQVVPTSRQACFSAAGPIPGASGQLARRVADLEVSGRVGLVGFEHAPGALLDRLRSELADCRLEQADTLVGDLLWRLRPRELSALRRAVRTIDEAASALGASRRAGASDTACLVEGEAAARRLGASDVRILYATPRSALRPLERQSHKHSTALAVYIAVQVLGYWVDLGLSFDAIDTRARRGDEAIDPRARRGDEALDAMTERLAVGARACDIAGAGLAALGDTSKSARRYGLGNAVGLSLDRRPLLDPNSPDLLEADMVLSLRVVLEGAEPVVSTRLVQLGVAGPEILLESPSQP